MSSRSSVLCLLLIVAFTGPAAAQTLLAEDDLFEVPFGETLQVEAFGVLDNDLLDGEAAGENGATVELVTDASAGALMLLSDGSFSYAPGPLFDGTDSFVYRAGFGGVSDEAIVTLSACSGGPQLFTCWKEGAFLALAAALGHPAFAEGFEDDAAWGDARSPFEAPEVASRGILWRANDFDPTHLLPPDPPAPPPNEITTGSGPARSGEWGVFDLGHGYATGTPSACDVDMPDAHCLYHDGFTLERETGLGPLWGAGGYFTGTFGANVAFVLDGDWQNPIGGGKLVGGGHQFFGVIDADPTGFDEIQVRELDGKVGQALFIFADDFTILAQPPLPVPTLGSSALVVFAGLLSAAVVRKLARPSRAGSARSS